MVELTRWQKRKMQRVARKILVKLYKEHMEDLEIIKDNIADLIEDKDTTEQINMVTIICSEIISGFEEVKDRNAVMDMIKITVQNLKQ